jgi:5-formyltetrahydrofolate cyclo-ligase
MKARRDAGQGFEDKDLEIRQRLFKFSEYKQAKSVLFYASMGNETETRQAIVAALSSKRVFLPYVVGDDLEISEIRSWRDVAPGKFKILEPKRKENAPISDVDLIIVPGVAFDERGHRIGYGGGYYDRLLARTKAPRVALAYESQIVASVPAEDHDQRVDKIVTEKRVITCSN